MRITLLQTPAITTFILLFSISLPLHAKTILVIESYHGEYIWDSHYTQALKDELSEKHQLIFFEMDTKRLDQTQFRSQADKAYKLYKEVRPDIVILGDDNALKLLGPRFGTTQTPTFFLGINNNPRRYFKQGIPANITGVLERPIFNRTAVAHLNSILPTANKVLVLLDKGITSDAIMKDLTKKRRGFANSITLDIKMHSTLKQWKNSVLSAKDSGYDCIIVALYQRIFDENGRYIDPNKIITWTSQHTQLPPFAFWSFAVGDQKAIGGTVVDGYLHGKASAQQIMAFIASNKMPAIQTPMNGVFVYNEKMLRKWNLSIPPNLLKKATRL